MKRHWTSLRSNPGPFSRTANHAIEQLQACAFELRGLGLQFC